GWSSHALGSFGEGRPGHGRRDRDREGHGAGVRPRGGDGGRGGPAPGTTRGDGGADRRGRRPGARRRGGRAAAGRGRPPQRAAGRGISGVADWTGPADVARLIDTAGSRHGGLDIAFNNAGTLGPVGPLAEIEEADGSSVVATNLTGIWLAMKYEIRYMREYGG